jgi:hypothetical protein
VCVCVCVCVHIHICIYCVWRRRHGKMCTCLCVRERVCVGVYCLWMRRHGTTFETCQRLICESFSSCVVCVVCVCVCMRLCVCVHIECVERTNVRVYLSRKTLKTLILRVLRHARRLVFFYARRLHPRADFWKTDP